MSDSWKVEEGGTYFVSFSIVGWIDLFTRRAYVEFLLKNLVFCQQSKGLLLYAFVIMPSHVHLIAGARTGLLTAILRDFKTYTSKELVQLITKNEEESRKDWLLELFHRFGQRNHMNRNNQVWQNTNHPMEIDSDDAFARVVDYIHQNPVDAGLCLTEEAYPWSSANPECGIELEEF